jgi:bifunctional DNA-binding transcriptional regulator/antitoxin component of YhaV-PrlF toxin-antitoxin module
MSYMRLTKSRVQPRRTRLSTKGQLVLPRAICAAHDWRAGTEFEVVDRADGVALKEVKRKGTIKLADLLGIARYKGPRKSIREMDAAIAADARSWR